MFIFSQRARTICSTSLFDALDDSSRNVATFPFPVSFKNPLVSGELRFNWFRTSQNRLDPAAATAKTATTRLNPAATAAEVSTRRRRRRRQRATACSDRGKRRSWWRPTHIGQRRSGHTSTPGFSSSSSQECCANTDHRRPSPRYQPCPLSNMQPACKEL